MNQLDIITDGPTLLLSGDFDVRSTGAVRSAINDQLLAGDGELTIDLHGVDSIDLTALKVLAAASRRANRTGRHIRLRGATAPVRRMLHLTHLIRLVDLERDHAVA